MTEVTISYEGKGPVCLPPTDKATIDIETYKRALCEEAATIPQMREELAQTGLEGDALESALNDKIAERMHQFEELQKVTKLRWVALWRIFEDRLKIATETERDRQKKADRAYKVKGLPEGEASPERIRRPARSKQEKAMAVLISLGFSEEQAKLRLASMPIDEGVE